jgi:AraC-like DNA-binding protein
VHQAFSDTISAFDGDGAAYRRIFEALAVELPFSQALVVSTFPRSGTQLVQPAHLNESLLRSYSKGGYLSDGPTWQAIIRRRPVSGNDCVPSGTLAAGDYYQRVMEPNGFSHVLAAPLPGPIFKGYPGAIHLYRGLSDTAFSPDEIRRFAHLADQLGRAIVKARDARDARSCGDRPAWERLGCCRQFIFDGQGRQLSVYDRATPLDAQIATGIRNVVQQRLEHVNGDPLSSDRVEFTDSHGENWAFHTVVHREFPALGKGPFVFLCIQPPACEWNAVRAADFAADPELARLVPTLKFMQQEFHRTPTLGEIAAKAHLSPFHFHRRFTELLGQTPKHFLLACQIRKAKQMLIERKAPLAEIAAECGFAHQSHFTSRFKQATGLTPTRWRRFAELQRTDAAASDDAAGEPVSPGCAS